MTDDERGTTVDSQTGVSGPAGDDDVMAVLDAAATAMLQRAALNGHYSSAMAAMTDANRAELEAATERHAARRRAAGEPGW